MLGKHSPRAKRAEGWLALQGRSNARLALLADAIGGELVPPADKQSFARLQGRLHGCVYTISIVHNPSPPPGPDGLFTYHEYVVQVHMRHFTANETAVLHGDGLVPPNLQVERLRDALEAACTRFAASRPAPRV